MDYTKLLERVDIRCKNCGINLVSFYNLGREIKIKEECDECGFFNDFEYKNDINYDDFDPGFMQRLSDIIALNNYSMNGEFIVKTQDECYIESELY